MARNSGRRIQHRSLVRVGDVFSIPLENGLYGACRVLRIGDPHGIFGDGPLVAACQWVGQHLPEITELRNLLADRSFGGQGQPIVKWLHGSPPREFVLVGQLQPTVEEQSLEILRGSTWEHFRDFILYEWLWEHDRQVALARKQADDFRARQQRS